MRNGSKAHRICTLLDQGLSVQEVAERVGCLDAYVRSVRQRRIGGGKSVADRNYEASSLFQLAKKRRCHRQRAYYRALRNSIDAAKARKASSAAYHHARKCGKTAYEANIESLKRLREYVFKHGDHAAAKQAACRAEMLGSNHEKV